ncbi:GNAT family N-acetyltransferase [Amycolatopsis nigrescens]|uniref:GNAT family N-acetyltransferase n=1 Tax=Amycolatopsis nigrescens TaxID=381445 RepID=UPI0003791B5C|nr:GNAT family N-acetyltransferase [Amycolatopsis nigrescens]
MIESEVRPGRQEDVDKAADVLAGAFADYAWTRHTVAADGHFERVRRFQWLFVAKIGLPHGKVWVADGPNGPAAVAVWTTPESERIGEAFGAIADELRELSGDRADAADAAEAAMAPHRPTEPVWFLGTVGVAPESQGKGLGRAVIEPGLAAADAAGVSAYLETSEPGNVRFYQRLGFEVTAEVALPGDGPVTWSMRR